MIGVHSVLSRAVSWLTRSPFNHVAFAHDGVVISPGWFGTNVHAALAYLLHHRGLRSIVTVPLARRIDLDGRVYEGRCVGVVLALLRDGGVEVPAWIVSPAQLHRHLLKRGFADVPIDPAIDIPRSRSCYARTPASGSP